ncbi:uncharacterized protein LOC124692707 [Lolium rigidum]|uniref:uncharacterized protein LOC124692707 n=1 Tax=Lolium rigidum TaxID=89674 RepID=UPI001F5C924F|nr:uncharacterized protein LOC124692707 [Lolium rigidum]
MVRRLAEPHYSSSTGCTAVDFFLSRCPLPRRRCIDSHVLQKYPCVLALLCPPRQCFTWIWEERLMDFVNAFVRMSTAAIEGEMRVARTESKWRIHQLEHKLEVARRELSDAIGERDGLNAVASRLADQLQSRDRSIFFYRLAFLYA